MKPSEALAIHREEIRRIVLENRATNPRVFGSVLRGEDTEESDLDILIDTIDNGPHKRTTLFDVIRIELLIKELTGVEVDVLTPRDLPEKFRNKVVTEAVSV